MGGREGKRKKGRECPCVYVICRIVGFQGRIYTELETILGSSEMQLS